MKQQYAWRYAAMSLLMFMSACIVGAISWVQHSTMLYGVTGVLLLVSVVLYTTVLAMRYNTNNKLKLLVQTGIKRRALVVQIERLSYLENSEIVVVAHDAESPHQVEYRIPMPLSSSAPRAKEIAEAAFGLVPESADQTKGEIDIYVDPDDSSRYYAPQLKTLEEMFINDMSKESSGLPRF